MGGISVDRQTPKAAGGGGAWVKANCNQDCWDRSTILLVLNVTWWGRGEGKSADGDKCEVPPHTSFFPRQAQSEGQCPSVHIQEPQITPPPLEGSAAVARALGTKCLWQDGFKPQLC